MRARWLVVGLFLTASLGPLAFVCSNGGRVEITQPTGDVTTSSFTIGFDLVGGPFGPPQAFLNFQPLVVSGGPTSFTASVTGGPTVDPGEPLRDENLLVVKALRADGVTVTAALPFAYDVPKARAYRIQDPGECPVSGPLAHRRLGDFCLENAEARFVVQDITAPAVPTDPTPRDLYSVGPFGGNLIDAVLPANPTTDNFLEFTPMLNIETIPNYQTITIVNDGQNGAPASIRTCGPDDLLDFVNPSSTLIDAGLAPPAGTDDTDQEIEACTTYALEPGARNVRVDTEVFNNDVVDLPLLVGDWMNAAGEVDGFFKPNPGIGEAVTEAHAGGLAWFAEPAVAWPDRFEYGYVPVNDIGVGGYVTISGVTVITHGISPAAALLGLPAPFVVTSGGSGTFTRYFAVDDGTGNAAQELANQVQGNGTGTLQGCVTVGGAPAPNAKVTVGTLDAGAIADVLAHFVTDATGCYEGQVEVPAVAGTSYGAAAALEGARYVGGTPSPPVSTFELFPAGDVETQDFALPATGSLTVNVVDEGGAPVPARITVVGLDASPEPTRAGQALPGFGSATLGLFNDVNDRKPFGVAAFRYTGADGVASFPLEPGSYHVAVSRGTEYSMWSTWMPGGVGVVNVVGGGGPVVLNAQIAPVLDTAGFVSSDFHVHGISSPDSQVADRDRAESFAGEGVDNIIATDHHAHKDYKPAIQALGLQSFVTATVGEEITTFDYGHFNGYPLQLDPSVPSGGSTDWAVAEPPGMDFPSYGAYNLAPAGIYTLATTQPEATASTTVQVNHIDSHFGPLKIDTSVVPPTDDMSAADRLARRLDPASPPLGQLFHAFPALELWNGANRGAQSEFLVERIGIWMNLLDQGIRTTAIADTDTHTFRNLRTAGARSWTSASPGMDAPATLSPDEVAAAVDAGRVVGGQGVYVQTRLLAADGSGAVADLTHAGSTSVTSSNGMISLEVSVQSPTWAPWDRIEIYSNAGGNVSSVVVDPLNPYLYGAAPLVTLVEGDCDPSTTGDGDFDVTVSNVHAAVPGADRWEATVQVPFTGLAADTWFVAVVRGTDGVCGPMYPVFPLDLLAGPNFTAPDILAALVDGNVGENGTMAMGFTNALYFEP